MIIVATPSRDLVHATFAYDLVQLMRCSSDAKFAIALGTHLPNLRTELVKKSLPIASHILFIDSDMRFPPDTLKRLKGLALGIVGANCKQRQKDEWTARKDGKFISSEGKVGSEEVDTLGFGVTLINTDVFSKLKQPWFGMPFDGERYVGEDVFFCTKAREVGLKIWVDHNLSQEIKHTGLKEY